MILRCFSAPEFNERNDLHVSNITFVRLGSGNENISWSNARQKIRELVKEMGCDILGLHCSYDGAALMIFVYGMTLES